MKIVESYMSNSWDVVDDIWGTEVFIDGHRYTKQPLPICRVPIGYGRDKDQAYAIARKIVSALTNLDELLATELPTADEIETMTKEQLIADHMRRASMIDPDKRHDK